MTVHSLPGLYEPVNAILHLGAAGVFAVLGVRLISRNRGDRLRVALLSVFAVSAVLQLSISGVYHMLPGDGTASAVLFRLDQAAIYVLIAGTFTPMQGLLFSGVTRWLGLAAMWVAAVTGATLVVIFFDHMQSGLGTAIYLALGWGAVFSVIAAWRRHGFRYVRSVIAGGLAYSVGAILLELDRPTLIPGVFGPHELWHIAVITGLSFHWRFIACLARDDRAAGARRCAPSPGVRPGHAVPAGTV